MTTSMRTSVLSIILLLTTNTSNTMQEKSGMELRKRAQLAQNSAIGPRNTKQKKTRMPLQKQPRSVKQNTTQQSIKKAKVYYCALGCNRSFSSKVRLALHMKAHGGKKYSLYSNHENKDEYGINELFNPFEINELSLPLSNNLSGYNDLLDTTSDLSAMNPEDWC